MIGGMVFQIRTSAFEGPLDLLLDLIEKRKLFVSDISLAGVADEYIAHVRSLASLPIGDTAHFLLVASTLVLIKSKSLLPDLTLSGEEESDIDTLKRRLAILESMRKAGRTRVEEYGAHVMFAYADQDFCPVYLLSLL